MTEGPKCPLLWQQGSPGAGGLHLNILSPHFGQFLNVQGPKEFLTLLQWPGREMATLSGTGPPQLDMDRVGRLGWAGVFPGRAIPWICAPCRRALYIVTFLLFPINVLVGVLAGVWRVVISGLYNAVHLCRLDISLLQRGVETFDPGGAARRPCATDGVLVPPRPSWEGSLELLGWRVASSAGDGTPGAGGFS